MPLAIGIGIDAGAMGQGASTDIGVELVTNGSFSSPTGWTTPAGWSIAGGVLTASAAAAFTTTSQVALNPPGLVAGGTYTVVFDVTAYTANGVRASFSGGTGVSGTTRTAVGTYTQDFVALSGNANLNIQAGAAGFTGSVDNFSVKRKS